MLEPLSLRVQREIKAGGGRGSYRPLPVVGRPIRRAATRLPRAAGCGGACPGPCAGCGSDEGLAPTSTGSGLRGPIGGFHLQRWRKRSALASEAFIGNFPPACQEHLRSTGACLFSLTRSPTHLVICSLTNPLTHPLTHSFNHSFILSLIHSLTHSLAHSLFIHPLTCSLTHPLTHSFIHSLTHSFIH